MAAPRISVVLPVYNEAGNIAACLRGLWAALERESHEILVVYDFDEDTTLPAIEAMPDRPPSVRLVRNEIGRGAANALRAGFAAAAGDAVVTTMADLSDPPELIPDMARAIEGGADVVSGSRYMEGGTQTGGPLLKRCMSQTASFLLNGVGGMTTLDATSNFRGYSKRFLCAVAIESDAGFEIALELTVKAHLAGRTVAEVPSSWIDRTDGESRFRLWKWLPNYLRWFTRAMREPACAWGVWLALTIVAGLVAKSPMASSEAGTRAVALAMVALFAAGGAGALVLARRLRGRTTWRDLLHPALWLAPPVLGLASRNVPLALAASAVLSACALGFGIGFGRLYAAARCGLARATDQRTLGVVLLGFLIWLTRTYWPRSTAGAALDASWEQGIGYALKNGFQWGEDILFTFGPLGYFNDGRFDPDLYWTKVLWWDFAFMGWLTAFFVLAILRIRGALQRTLAVLVLVLPMQGHDAYFFLVVVAITAWLLERSDRPTLGTAFGLVPLAAVALIKFTPLVLTFACVGLVALVFARRRSLASGAFVLAIFGSALCAIWVLLGQSLLNLPAYFSSSATISSAYNEAMTVFGPVGEVKLAVGVAILAGLVAALAALERPRRIERLALAAAIAAGLFLAGKAGFVRHGNNAITFFCFAACVTFLIPSLPVGTAGTPPLSRVRVAGSALCAVLATIGYHVALEHEIHSPNRLFGDWIARFSTNAQTLVDLDGERAKLALEREELALVHGLPRLAERVGGATVDMIHSRQGAILLSDMNWHPRPVFQGYYSYAPELLAANRAFLESSDAPRYLVFRTETLDGRLPNMDDSQATLVMMRDYRPLVTEKDYLLLERKPAAPLPSREVVLDERTLAFDEPYELPPLADAVHLLRIDVRYSALGRAGTMLAKSPQVTIHVTRGREEAFKLIPGMARSGVILKPFPVGQDAWLHWFSGGGEQPISSVRVTVNDGARSWFRPEIDVALVRVDGITPEAGDLRRQLDFSSFDPAPDVVRVPTPVELRTLRGKEFVIVHAPSELRFDLAAGRYALTGGFGLDPRSYRQEPFTDGAGFGVFLVDSDGAERQLWSRTLDPVDALADCRLQPLELTFDAPTGGQLCLRTDPGPTGDGARDLAFWHELRIGPGR